MFHTLVRDTKCTTVNKADKNPHPQRAYNLMRKTETRCLSEIYGVMISMA